MRNKLCIFVAFDSTFLFFESRRNKLCIFVAFDSTFLFFESRSDIRSWKASYDNFEFLAQVLACPSFHSESPFLKIKKWLLQIYTLCVCVLFDCDNFLLIAISITLLMCHRINFIIIIII